MGKDKLTDKEKAKIEKQYERARKEVSKKDVEYPINATEEKLEKANLLASGIEWIVKLGKQVKLLWQMLRDSWKSDFDVPWTTIAAIAAALIYFINPWDLIPDFIPVVGYLDDATVIALCIKLIGKDLERYCKWKKIDPTECGL